MVEQVVVNHFVVDVLERKFKIIILELIKKNSPLNSIIITTTTYIYLYNIFLKLINTNFFN